MNLLHKWSAQGSSQYIGEYMFGQVLCTSAQPSTHNMMQKNPKIESLDVITDVNHKEKVHIIFCPFNNFLEN